jgi:hypothetical protein
LASDPNYIVAYIEKSRALKRKGMMNQSPAREALMRRALDILTKAREQHPEYYPAVYNMACYKALLGMPAEEVLADLRKAIELNPGLKDAAREDSDLDAVRQSAQFQELVGR